MIDLYSSIILIALLSLTITVADISINRLITRETKTKAIIACVIIGVSALGECVGVLTDGGPASLILLHKVAKLVELSMAPAIGVAVAVAYGEVIKPKVAIGLTVMHAIFEIIAVNFGWIFSVDASNIYHREVLFPIYVIAFVLSIAYGFWGIILKGKKYQINIDIVLILTLLIIAIGILFLFVSNGIRIAYLCIAMGNLLFYIRYYKIIIQIDAITGLLNRKCYEWGITKIGSHAMIMLFDVDKFKQVNDTYGHCVGDVCLRSVATTLKKVYGPYGKCYRIGGDEFCVILKNNIENLEILNEKFTSAINEIKKEDSRMPGVSLGYSCYDAAASDIQNVIQEADAMLYKNKNLKVQF